MNKLLIAAAVFIVLTGLLAMVPKPPTTEANPTPAVVTDAPADVPCVVVPSGPPIAQTIGDVWCEQQHAFGRVRVDIIPATDTKRGAAVIELHLRPSAYTTWEKRKAAALDPIRAATNKLGWEHASIAVIRPDGAVVGMCYRESWVAAECRTL